MSIDAISQTVLLGSQAINNLTKTLSNATLLDLSSLSVTLLNITAPTPFGIILRHVYQDQTVANRGVGFFDFPSFGSPLTNTAAFFASFDAQIGVFPNAPPIPAGTRAVVV